MNGLFDLAETIKSDRKYIYYMSQFTAEYCELYVDLVCVYQPENILNTLKVTLIDYSYRLEECLRTCRKRKVWEGVAYLLEASGQIEDAFTLKSEKLTGLIHEFEEAFLNLNDADIEFIQSNIDANLVSLVQLCQRNSQALNEATKEKIWFTLFDQFMKPIQSIQHIRERFAFFYF